MIAVAGAGQPNLGSWPRAAALVGRGLLLLSVLLCGPLQTARGQGEQFRPPGFELGFLVLLTEGERYQGIAPEDQERIRTGHGMHLLRLMQTGVIELAGPFQVQPIPDLGGALAIEVYRVESREDVDRLMAEDPAIREGMFRYRVYPIWLPPQAVPR